MRSYFGRVNLNWDDRYLLEANLRADGSSRFAPGHRWGWFPSVSAGWRLSQEAFMQASRGWLDNLKVRASYGTLGNNSTTTYYMYQSLFATQGYVLGATSRADSRRPSCQTRRCRGRRPAWPTSA